MNAFIDAAFSRSRTTLSLLAVLVLAGIMARAALPIANDPHVDLPFYYVGVIHDGISPEDAERLLVQPMELELRKLEGVVELKSTAAEGMASFFVEFDVSQDLNRAIADVRAAVDRAGAELPSTAEEPFVQELTVDDFPMLQINFVGESASERSVYQAARQLRDDIASVPSVLSADLQGQRDEVLEVVVNPDALNSYRISAEELVNTLQRNNRLIAAGSVDTNEGRFAVKIPAVVEDAQDVLDLPIRTSEAAVVTLGDVATVRRTFKDRASYARYNGRETISIEVKKRANANVIDSVDAVLAIVAAAKTRLPAGMELIVSQNKAEFAAVQVKELEGNILTALALVMVVVVAIMGFRSGIVVGLGIPFSLLFSVIVIYLLGYTFNFMVMFGMLLGLGMLIDGGIVVTEYANRMMAEQGMDHKAAYAESVKRMFWPVAASTATTLAAFLPMLFWPGVSGQFMGYLPVTVFTVLIGSLLYALLFGPVLGSMFGKPSAHSAQASQARAAMEGADPTQLNSFTGKFARVLTVVVHRPVITLVVIFSVLLSIFWAYGKYGVGTIFFSDAQPQFIQVAVLGRGNFSANEVNDLVLEAEREILKIPGIRFVNAATNLPGVNSMDSGTTSDRIGAIFVELYPESKRSIGGNEVMRQIRERTAHLAGIQVEVRPLEKGPPVGKPIQIELTSRDRSLLEPAMARIRAHMDTLPSLIDIDDTATLPSIEWRIEVDRTQAALYGADVSSAGLAVQLVTSGVKLAEYRPDDADDSVDIRVRYPQSERGVKAIETLRVSTKEGMVPLSNFVKVQPAPGVDLLKRIDGVPVELIRADVASGVMADAMVREIDSWLQQQTFDTAVTVRFRGANEEQAESMAFVSAAFSLALALMFILLVTQFNNFYQSALILVAVVMSTAGVLLGLLVLAKPFSALLTGVGVLALAGIVVNNNIILIDTFNHLRRTHPDMHVQAVIVRATAQRLRPVLLTTVTTVCGLLPLACGFSVDLPSRTITPEGEMAMFWAPLSQAIVFGLSFATVLTLFATPAMLALPEAVIARLPRRLRGHPTDRAVRQV